MQVKIYLILTEIISFERITTKEIMNICVLHKDLPKNQSDIYFLISVLNANKCLIQTKKGNYDINLKVANEYISNFKKENELLINSFEKEKNKNGGLNAD